MRSALIALAALFAALPLAAKNVTAKADVKASARPFYTDRFLRVGYVADPVVGGEEAAGYRAAMTSLARGRVHIAALAVGTAQRALDESVAHAAASTQQTATRLGHASRRRSPNASASGRPIATLHPTASVRAGVSVSAE